MKSAKLSLKDNLKRIIATILVALTIFVQVPWSAIAAEVDEIEKAEEITVALNDDNNVTEDAANNTTENGTDENVNELEINIGNEVNQNATNNNEENVAKDVTEEVSQQQTQTPAQVQQPAPQLRAAPSANQLSEENAFKVNLRWGGTSNTAYSWNATQQENRVIKLTFYYQNEVTPRAYEPGDLVVTIPGIGKLNRSGIKKATDIAADVYGSAVQKRDWSYTYDARTDTYTFYNNKEIEQGASFNGSFEMIYEFSARQSVNGYFQALEATLTDGEQTATSQQLTLEFTSKRDTFYINKSARAMTSIDGLNSFVAQGKTARDYAWIRYTFRYNTQELNARGLKNRYFIDTFPAGCVITQSANVIHNQDGTISYKIQENSVPENSVREYSITVGYPEEYVGQTIENTAYIYGNYYDENEDTLLAQSTVEVMLEKIESATGTSIGIVPRKNMSPDIVYNDSLDQNINFTASLYGTTVASPLNDREYTLALTDDLMEIIAQDDEDSTKTKYYTLQDDEYKYTSITVPGKNTFSNSNGYTISDGNYNVKLYALYAENANTRAFSEYTLVDERAWGTNSYTKELEGNVVAIRAEISGLKESINSFYILTRGTINISESNYIDPTYIINYDIIEYLDNNGHSLLPALSRENYSQERLYDRDIAIYGEGVRRSNDTIRIMERPIVPPTPIIGTYSAIASMTPFEVDENVEYFLSTLTYKTDVNNIEEREISTIEVHGVVNQEELETLEDTIELQYSGLKFKTPVSADTDMQDYLMQRATITKNGQEISISFDFSDNPITSSSFGLGYTVESRLNYEDYYDSTNPSYSIRTYAYTPDGGLRPQSIATHNSKTMATDTDSKSILIALASHQELIKMVKTMYTEGFVQEDAVTPINTDYTYRLKLRNGYNTLVETEFIDVLEHAELTEVDGEYPYTSSEWYGTFKNIDVTYIESKGLTTKAYYANTLTPTDTDWVLMESYNDGIWSTLNPVKAIKVEIEGEISENSIAYIDVNMTAPNDESLVDKKARNAYTINCKAVDLYSGIFSTYMDNLPSNEVDVRLTKKEYNVIISKTDATSGTKLAGVQFGIYDSQGNKIRTSLTGILGNTVVKNLKEGTYTIKEEITPDGYKGIGEHTLIINNGAYSVDRTRNINETNELSFASSGSYAWTQNADGTWQSNNYNVNSSTTTMVSNSFTMEFPGTVSFDWSVSSQGTSYDFAYYTIKNQSGQTISGTGNTSASKIGGTSYGTVYDSLRYNRVTKSLPAGTYTIEFTYYKSASTHSGLDRAFVKNAVFSYSGTEQRHITDGNSTLENNIPTINFNIENERAKGSITVHKIDEYKNENQQEIPLANVQFDLLNQEGTVVSTKITNAEGNAVFNNLDWGANYTIQERTQLQGYELAENTNTYLSRQDKDKTVVVENKRKTGSVELTKQDEIDGTLLEGATYGLFAEEDIYDKDGNVLYAKDTLIKEANTDTNGKVNFDELIWGDYYLKETKTIYGYDLSEVKHLFTINAQNVDTLIEKTENEKRSKANLQLVKIDDKGAMLQGVEFGLYNAADDSEVLRKEVTMSNELIFTQVGNYGWKQKVDGTWKSDNYNIGSSTAEMESNEFTLLQPETLSFDWSVSSQGTSSDYLYYTITNTQNNTTVSGTGNTSTSRIGGTSYGSVEESLSYVTVQKELQPGTYKLKFSYTKNLRTNSGLDAGFVKNININCEDYPIESYIPITGTTNEVGQLNIEGIEWGNYYLKETKTIDGYEMINTKFDFTVDRNTFQNNNTTVTRVINEETDEETSTIRNTKKQGHVILTKYAAEPDGTETDTVLPDAEYELYLSNGTLVGTYTTDAQGQIEVENLDWNSYYFLEKNAPTGYSTSDKKLSFVINSKNVSFLQELSAYDKPESGEITINKTIKASDLYNPHGNATFTFKIVGKDAEENVKLTLYRTITFSNEDITSSDINGNITKTIKITDIDPYKYEITEEENYRYELDEIIPVSNNSQVSGQTGIINLSGVNNKGEITFANNKDNNSLLTDSEIITNSMQSEFYLIGIEASAKEDSYVIGSTLTANDFTIKLYYSGGQEVELQTTQGVTINGENSYTQTGIGDYIVNVEYTTNGKTFETEVPTTWVMPSDYFVYSTNTDGSINITGINANYTSPEVLYIPAEVNGKRVNAVGGQGTSSTNKLSNINNVKSVEIAEGVRSIEYYAFYGYSKITSIEIPDSVTRISQYAFYGCSGLTSVEIPDSVTTIGSYAFGYCSGLTSIEIPDSVTWIGSGAFLGCSGLTSVEIPNSVRGIVDRVFQGCSSLTSIEIPDSITSIGSNTFSGCSGLTSIEIPDSVTSIGQYAFSECRGLTSIEIPDSVTSIGSYAFSGCRGLTSIEIPDSITSIQQYVFQNCSSLTSIEIPDSVTSIGSSAFYGCSSLTSIEIPDSVTSIGSGAFYGCSSLTSIEIPVSITSIEDATFRNCSGLTSIEIPDSVTRIGCYAFSGCSSLTSIEIPDGITSIADATFEKCRSLTSIEIPDSVTSIGSGAFSGSGLTSIEIPNTVTSIGSGAFANCGNLTSIEIPNTITSIGVNTFSGCSNLTSIEIPNTVTSIGSSAFSKSGLTSIEIPDGITSIQQGTFSGCSRLTSIEIPDSVTSIGSSAFSGCSRLTSIEIPVGITSIEAWTFLDCSSLTSIEIPDSVTGIGQRAFSGCSSLTSIEIPVGITSIEQYTFSGCSSLTSIVIPDSVTSIGNFAFSGCSRLTTVYYRGTQAQFGAITIGVQNVPFTNATKVYEYTGQ